jgi:activator of 2-hydroxyglutaryl-CoA dehydratase
MCQGVDIADVADAVLRFMAERIAAICTTMSLTKEIVAAGGLAKSKPLIRHLSSLIKQDVSVLSHTEYVGAIGAVICLEGN